MKLDILAFGAHPDDVELNCGGCIARLAQQGYKIGIVDLTQGQMGSRGNPELRIQEADAASKVLGIHTRANLGFKDTLFVNDRDHQLAIIEQLRLYRPDICIIGAPDDRHPDHGKATQLLLDAIFYSGLAKIESGNNQEAWRPGHVIHYMQDRPFEADFIFDISHTLDIKLNSLKAFQSQFDVSEEDDEPETYISTPGYFQQIIARAKFYGHLGGFEYGEPFKYANGAIPINSFDVFSDTKPKR